MIYFFSLLLGFQEPMNVSIGDDPLPLKLVSYSNGGEISLSDRVDNTFCFFLLPGCNDCVNAMGLITSIQEDYDVTLIFLGKKYNVTEYLETVSYRNTNNVFLVKDDKPMLQHNVKTFPALIAYKNSKLKLATHGVLSRKQMNRILGHYEKNK